MRKLIMGLVLAGATCSFAGATEPICSVVPPPAVEPAIETSVTSGTWCCLGPWNVCEESTPETCAAAGSRVFDSLGLCYRRTGSCESP
jgi:hypothetical protein